MSDFTFLTEEQCFGSQKLDILEKRGTVSATTDFSLLLGGNFSAFTIDGSLEGRTGDYWTKSDDGDCDAYMVDSIGDRNNDLVILRATGARPALPFYKHSFQRKYSKEGTRWNS